MAYYILKPVREALILGEGSAELKTYMSAGQVVVLAFVVPFYGRLVASRPTDAPDQHRHRVLHRLPVVFYVLAQFGVPLGVVVLHLDRHLQPDDRGAVLVVRQRRLYEGEGERLFAIVGFGASLGAVVGARAAIA